MTSTVGEASDARQQTRAGSPPTARVVRIVELLAATRQPLTIAEIVRRTGLSRATAHAIVAELVEHGWLLREAAGTITIGPAFAALARVTQDADHLSRWAGAAARDLCDRHRIPFFVARRTSADVVRLTAHAFPSVADSAAPSVPDGETHPWLRHGSRIRMRPPICREFVAWDPPAEREEWIARAAGSTRTRLRLALDVVADRGYSIERLTDDHIAMIEALSSLDTMSDTLRARVGDLLGELSVIDYLPDELDAADTVPVVTVGAPIFDDSGRVVAAMVACPNSTLDVDELRTLADSTRAAADRISTHLR